jgi:hypothetical protein
VTFPSTRDGWPVVVIWIGVLISSAGVAACWSAGDSLPASLLLSAVLVGAIEAIRPTNDPARRGLPWSRSMQASQLRLLALGALAFLTPGCTSAPSGAGPAPPPATITVCGEVESIQDVEKRGGIATWLTIADARSGSRFVFEIAPEVQTAFEAALGTRASAAYRGASICATGTHPDESERPLFAVASPADVTINPRAR